MGEKDSIALQFFCHVNSPTAMGGDFPGEPGAPLNSPQAQLSAAQLACAELAIRLADHRPQQMQCAGWVVKSLSSCHLALVNR